MKAAYGWRADMATAPGHLLGQIIGNILEEATKPVLQELADRHDLYLDAGGPRPGVRNGTALSWSDGLGNKHDLDIVLERGGDVFKSGVPAAFVEAAWRRYTKHSKAKAQEIQGAVLPLVAKWNNVKPTPAAVVAGAWSRPSIDQMRTSGFVVLQLTLETTIEVFSRHGIDIAGEGEGTSDDFWQSQCDAYARMSDSDKRSLATDLREAHLDQFQAFAKELEHRVIRSIESVIVTPLHGTAREFVDINEAINLVVGYSCAIERAPFVRYDIRINYSNGDQIQANFATSLDAVDFLNSFA